MNIHKNSNKGAALVTVIMVMLVSIIFIGIVLTLITSQSTTEVFYEDNISSLHAAETGLHKYLWDLNKDSAAPIVPLDTDLNYPTTNPTAKFNIHELSSTDDQKKVEVTGWMINDSSVKRTIRATIKKRAFHQYVYFSNNEPNDIWWMSSDNCYGPYHSNTSLYVSGTPTFWSNVSYVDQIKYYTNASVDRPNFHVTPQRVSPINYPANNNELKAYAISDGYYYTGRTRIRLNSDGKVTILNTNKTPNLQTRDLPPNGVIYVDGTVVNASNKFDNAAGNVFISGVLDGKLTVAASNDIYVTGYDPISNSFGSSTVTNGIVYKDTGFSLDPSTGVTTVTGAGQNDMLGLVANRYVAVLTRGWFDNNYADTSVSHFTIHGAIFAINGKFINSFQIDSTSETYPHTPGTLTVRGAIIQYTRGAVSQFSGNTLTAGYAKDYAHDPRMESESPPNFLRPVDSGWEITEWEEIN